MFDGSNEDATYEALANTKQPPAKPPPQQAQPIPSVHAICLSSFDAVHSSNHSPTLTIAASQYPRIALPTPATFCHRDNSWPSLLGPAVVEVGGIAIPEKGAALISDRAARRASSLLVNSKSRARENAIKKKNPSQPPRLHKCDRWAASVSVASPLLMEPKATMPITPTITMMVPWDWSGRCWGYDSQLLT